MLSIKKTFKGTTSETFSFGSAMKKINITNDGTNSLTATINSKSIIVPGESSRELEFSSFMQATITATGAFRGYVMNDLTTGNENRQPSLVIGTPDTTAPNAVTGLSAGTATANSMPLTWALGGSNDVVNHEVAYSSNGGTTYTVASATVGATATSYTVTGLTASTSYTFRVVAIDGAGNRSTAVTVVKATIAAADTTPPNPVTSLAAGTATANSMPLTWVASGSSDKAKHEVAYSTDGTNFTIADANVLSSATSYTVTGLSASTSYTFRVVVIDGAGNRSTAATVVKATIAAADTTAPAQVQGLTVTNTTHDSISVSWTANTDDTVSYDVTIEEVVITSPAVVTNGLILDLNGMDASTTDADAAVSKNVTWYDQSGANNHFILPVNGLSKISPALWDATLGFKPGNSIKPLETANYTGGMQINYNLFNNYPVTWELVMKPASAVANELIKVSGGATTPYYRLWVDNTGRLILYKNNTGSGNINFTIDSALMTQYIHIVLTIDAVVGANVYINGVLVDSDNTPPPALTDDAQYGRVELGNTNSPYYVKRYRAYNRVLADSEITQNYTASSALLG